MDGSVPLRYVPGRSWLHRSSPIPKLAWLLAVLVVVLATYEPLTLAVVIVAGVLLCLGAGVGGAAARTLVALAPVSASIIVLQALAPVACRAACTPVASLGPLTIYGEGMTHALALVARLVAMELMTVAMLATTHPSDLFAAARQLRLPYEVALMGMLSLQLVAELRGELRTVLGAQRARGMRASGIGALVPTLVPVVAASFDRVTTLALSLEARGLGSGPRTSYRHVSLRPVDRLAAVLALPAALAGVAVSIARSGADGSTGAAGATFPAPLAVGILLGAVVVFLVVMAAGLRALARL